jgi:hypothetical protein
MLHLNQRRAHVSRHYSARKDIGARVQRADVEKSERSDATMEAVGRWVRSGAGTASGDRGGRFVTFDPRTEVTDTASSVAPSGHRQRRSM